MKRQQIKSCCGGSGYVFELDVPLSKSLLDGFKQAGYRTTENYIRVGVFFVQKDGLTASGPFGSTRVQVRCGGSANCSQMVDGLENTFKSLEVGNQ